MIILKTKIRTDKSKEIIVKLLKDKIFTNNDLGKIHIFPFSLFFKSFYKDLKLSFSKFFIGSLTNYNFNLEPYNTIFSTRTNLPLILIGQINDNKLEVNYKIPNYFFLIHIVFNLIFIGLIMYSIGFTYIVFLVNGIFIFSYIFKIIRFNRIFNKICK